jgi:hypothetical protein
MKRWPEKKTFARDQNYYGFPMPAPPIVPDLDKKVKPKRSMICVLAVFVGFFAAVVLAFMIEFVRKIKRDDPERFALISNELRLFRVGAKKREKVWVGV